QTHKHFVEPFAVPSAVHVRLAKTERTLQQRAAKEARVMHLDVPRSRTVDANIGTREQRLGATREPGRAGGCQGNGLGGSAGHDGNTAMRWVLMFRVARVIALRGTP